MADHHAREIDTFFLKDPLLVQPHAASCMSMRGNWNAGLAVSLCRGSQDSFYVPGDAGLVSGALQYAGSYTCVRDAFIDIAHEHFHHEFGTAQHGTGPAEMKIVRRIVIGIDPRGDDDIDFCL